MVAGKRIFDDLARVAGGAANVLSGLRGEVETLVRQQLERLLAEMEVVPRDEFDAVKAMAAKARAEQQKLAKRVAELEARVEGGAAKRTTPKG